MAGKSGKKKGGPIPKSVAGVKIPKALRKKGGKLLAQANSPAGREVIAAGLTMAAAAATAAVEAQRVKRARAAAPADPATGEPAAQANGGADDAAPAGVGAETASPARPGEPGIGAIDPQAIADTVGKAADALLTRLFGAAPKP